MESPIISKQKTFHSRAYSIDLFLDSTKLRIKLREISSGGLFSGDFSIQFIETLTHKAGSSKKFSVFLNMLISSIENTSSAVSIDFESHADLEKLRNKPLQGNSSNSYLILTYTAEFDKVYYPLPLIFQKEPELKQDPEQNPLFLRLNQEKSQLLEENSKLKTSLETSRQEKELLKKDLDEFKVLTNKEIQKLQNIVEDLKKKLIYSKKSTQSNISKPSFEQLKAEYSKIEFEKKVLEAEVKSLKLMNKKKKLKINELRKMIEGNKENFRERSKSLLGSEHDVTRSTISSRCKSSVRSSYNSEEISAKLEKIANLLALNERSCTYYE
jgi:coiled-coil domain-containing protein 61